ncbi:MAG: SMP-30/gluconolactonase/LRE family protein [Sphingobium sp.]|uniref:SMP-30/gluconolactonase/LRE family protein n=1 Tax=Sphingobium sp. TaxID=1912891 RepID=UPI0029AC4382|nr:SMP-30/gluconolactonase/LRE family protein [Sphingobium sp.]MDX3910754.1 SMP-30/gluconolactonase/LRE family protein [Sphingobium sp.]
MESQPQPVLKLGAALGEGPIWVGRDRALWFVDIKAPAIYRFDPETEDLETWAAPAQVGWIVPAARGDFIVGLQTGVHRFDPSTSAFTLLHDPEAHLPGNRLNDATVDHRGRIWLGSMDDAEEAVSGRIYRMDEGSTTDTGLSPVTITNGPAVSPDGTILYHVDTLGRTIWQSRIGDDGTLEGTAPFVTIEEGAGHPDGPVVDAEGCVWIGLFGGWGVRRYDPAGELISHVAFPVANITKIAFGGGDLSTVYATTARKGLSEAELQEQPYAGDLFAFRPGVRGLAAHHALL